MRCALPALLALALSCSADPLAPRPDGNGDSAGDPSPGDPTGDPNTGDPNLAGDPLPPVVYETVRAIIHAHSIWSHDGCAGDGFPYGTPGSDACLAEMRAAPCTLGIDLLSLTDHPNNVQDQSFTDALHYDPSQGDQLVMLGSDAIANRVTCASGHSYLITAGYEDQHSMPLGLHHTLPNPEDYEGITDATPITTVQARVAALEAAGAVAALVHSEEDNISVPHIRDGGFTVMEWYNIHANIMAFLDMDGEYLVTGGYQTVIDSLTAIDAFLLGSGSGAHADLVYLAMLPVAPHQGFDKWAAITGTRAITGILGTDVHRNVEVDVGICDGVQLLCDIAAELYPSVLTLLASGGTIQLTDSEQIDSYRRVMSWTENRILVTGEVTPLTIADALESGASYGLFTVFGEPDAFSFEIEDGDGSHPIGTTLSGPGTLHVVVPSRPVALPNYVPFTPTEADLAEIRAVLVFTDASGRSVVRESATSFDFRASTAGAYHLEIIIRPLHLAPHLGSEDELADAEALWLITNPVRVTP